LYASVPLMGGLLVLEYRAALPPGWHTVVRIGIVLFIYSLVWRWLHANTLALAAHWAGSACNGAHL